MRGDPQNKKTTRADLVVGGRYLHRNRTWVRVIMHLDGDIVHWQDELGAGVCSRIHFIKTCPWVAGQETTSTAAPPERQDSSLPSGADPDLDAAMFIAMVVRNAMEDFHAKHLSDEQMKQLNPIIRSAIYTALHVLRNTASDEAARAYRAFHQRMIPSYWEKPQLLEAYLSTREFLANRR